MGTVHRKLHTGLVLRESFHEEILICTMDYDLDLWYLRFLVGRHRLPGTQSSTARTS